MRADTYFGIKYNRDRSRDTFTRDRRATRSTFYRPARSVRFRITDHTGTPVELDTCYDQRWISAVQPRESWYLMGWIKDSPINFLVDPGAVVSAISLQSYERLVDAGAIHTALKLIQMELEAANKSDMTVHGMCSLELSLHGLVIHIDTVVVDLAILGMDILGDATKLPFILDLVDGTLSGGGYETIQLHHFHAATECFAETTDTVCIPPHSEVMLWAKKTNNGRRGPTVGVVLALQRFVQEFGILVGRSLVRADANDWKVLILLYNSDPCTKRSNDCKCNPVIILATQ